MISIYALKPRFQSLLRPLVRWLANKGITANQVTLAAAVGSLLVALGVAWGAPLLWPYALIPLWMLLRMALNAIDGMLTREFGQQSRLGAYLNELCDDYCVASRRGGIRRCVGVNGGSLASLRWSDGQKRSGGGIWLVRHASGLGRFAALLA